MEPMAPPEEIYQYKDLRDYDDEELKDILQDRHLSTKGDKTDLIKRILKYQKRMKTENESYEIDEYLPGGKIYNEFMEAIEFNSHFVEEPSNYPTDRYNKYMKRLIKEKEKGDNYEIKRTKRKLNELIKDKLGTVKHYKKLGKEALKEIQSYPDPKYFDITLTKDQIDTIISTLNNEVYIYSIKPLLKEYTGIKYDFKPGDIIGLRTLSNNSLPDYIIPVHKNLTGYRAKVSEKAKIKYNKTGEYYLPGELSNISIIEDVELIYKFPFASHIGKKTKLI